MQFGANALDLDLAKALLENLGEQIAALSDRIERGFPKDYAAYRELVGELRALRAMQNEIIDRRAKILNPS